MLRFSTRFATCFTTYFSLGVSGALIAALSGCSDLTGTTLPSGVKNPSAYNTPAGAQGLYTTTFYAFETSLLSVVRSGGLLTDELEDQFVGTSPAVLQGSSVVTDPLDERILPAGSDAAAEAYGNLQAVRAYAGQARAALLAYDTVAADSAKVRTYRGLLAMYTGYAEMWLADYYCSGVPLSTVDFQKDFTYAASSTTTQVYRAALAQFDTALAFTRDSTAVQNTIHVARARVYLALGQYDSAAAEVHDIPTSFQYRLSIHAAASTYYPRNFITAIATVSDNEGGNGLPYVSSGDPRTTVTVLGVSTTNTPIRYPSKYANNTHNGFTPFVLASGVEARLIEAEVAVHNNPASTDWLTTLNTMRTSGAPTLIVFPDTIVDTLGYTGCISAVACDHDGYQIGVDYSSLVLVSSDYVDMSGADVPGGIVDVCRDRDPDRTYACGNPQLNIYVDPAHLDTIVLYHAGTGGVNGLPPLSDPGVSLTGSAAAAARTRLVFDERAYWLFLTGHRQGDLRRLVRQYGLPQDHVYPVGDYTAPGAGVFGTDVTMPIPSAESANPNFHGCIDRNA